jgi:hypothetical protein
MADPRYRSKILEIYFSSPADKKRIMEKAKESGSTTSKYIQNLIEESYREKPVICDTKERDEEIRVLQNDLHLRDIRISQQDQELARLRAQAWSIDGARQVDMRLIEVLKAGPIQVYRLLEALGVDSHDVELIGAYSRQLEMLEAHGVVKKNSNGWSWNK